MKHSKKSIEQVLQEVKAGEMSIDEAKERLKPYDHLSFAKLDVNREARTGFPEVIYGEGKTAAQLIEIIEHIKEKLPVVLATRVDVEKAKQVMPRIDGLQYNETARTLLWKKEAAAAVDTDGYIAVVCAGTSDLPVAEEAAVTAEAFGCRVERINDVGVAGLQRLLDCLEVIRGATIVVCAAGMEGALTSVLAGLIHNPIIAVPTSVGYGANFGGLSALLSMLNTCAPGVSVVNIDNGFGAGYHAAQLYRLINGGNHEHPVL
ncbi:MAG TPA: nickel pincer cofactor biosynthesis protein LarB [Bacillales bacterium]|nr:nickel pincer cofactor biosynthesis protein LarB [Bacillales bacterium]